MATNPEARIEYVPCEQLVERILRLSERMLAAARRDDWRSVEQHENLRRDALEALYAHPDYRQRLPELAEPLNRILAMSRECIVLGEQARHSMTVQMLNLQRGRCMSRAYLQDAG